MYYPTVVIDNLKNIQQSMENKGVIVNISAANKHVPEIENIYSVSRKEHIELQ